MPSMTLCNNCKSSGSVTIGDKSGGVATTERRRNINGPRKAWKNKVLNRVIGKGIRRYYMYRLHIVWILLEIRKEKRVMMTQFLSGARLSYQAEAIARTEVGLIRPQKADGIQNSGWEQQPHCTLQCNTNQYQGTCAYFYVTLVST
jgi:hypothetical protein